MAGPKTRTTAVVKGVVAPSLADVKKVVTRLRKEVNTNPALAKKFKKDPRGVLSAFGLNEDVQNELLRDMGVTGNAAICWFTECYHTCWFTKCVFTHLVVEKEK